jgi:LPXTG-motif cell wall-anchored protein
MRVPRRLLPLLACALIAGTPAVAQAQGGAGDDQYQDPFGGSSGGGSSSGGGDNGSSAGSDSGSSGSTAQDTGSDAPELTQDPDLGTSSSSTSSSSAPAPATSSATAPATTTRSELPRTGFDAPVVALLGLGLLAAGVGLRLRVAHGRRS